MTEVSSSPRHRAYMMLEHPTRSDRPSWGLELLLIMLVLVSVIAVSLETVPSLAVQYARQFQRFDLAVTLVFTLEYLARIWVAPEGAPGLSATQSRLRYLRSPMAIVDLLAILPFFLALFIPMDFQLLQVLRLLRIYKLTRYSPALSVLFAVIREESATLIAAFLILAVLLVFAASGAYLVEHKAQPEAFGSVPAAMWWSLVTLTTVGYGDVTPITPLGRIFGGAVTILGVGMAALPAGIIASGLADHLHWRRDRLREGFRRALADGKIDMSEGRQIETLRRELGISRDAAHGIFLEVRRKQIAFRHCTCPSCGHQFELETRDD